MRRIYKVAIVEDETSSFRRLEESLRLYEDSRKDVQFNITAFQDGDSFLSSGKNHFDIVFMDIDLPGMSGMECAARLRKTDTVVTLIFVTGLAQYAVQGYNVSALDYIVKPVTYKNFAVKMERALGRINMSRNKCVVIMGNELYRVATDDIIYIEIQAHRLTFHLINGQTILGWGVLKKLADELKDYGFGCCSSCFLLNFKYVISLNSTAVKMIDGSEFTVTRRRKEPFMAAFSQYIGNGGGNF